MRASRSFRDHISVTSFSDRMMVPTGRMTTGEGDNVTADRRRWRAGRSQRRGCDSDCYVFWIMRHIVPCGDHSGLKI